MNQQGLMSTLKELHDNLDEAVAAAYAWPVGLPEEEILERLVRLNAARALEERRGLVRYLRPAYQDPRGATEGQMLEPDTATAAPLRGKQPFPKEPAAQAHALRGLLVSQAQSLTLAQISGSFKGARQGRVQELLEIMVSLGQARQSEGGYAWT